MTDYERRELFEIYRLHAESADRVSDRRERAHRLYVTLFIGLALFLGGLLQLGSGSEQVRTVLRLGGFAGMVLAASWYVVGRSYRELNSGKFKVLHELEKQLTYPFYTREWELLKGGKRADRYWKLTVVESVLPVAFFVLSVVLIWSFW